MYLLDSRFELSSTNLGGKNLVSRSQVPKRGEADAQMHSQVQPAICAQFFLVSSSGWNAQMRSQALSTDEHPAEHILRQKGKIVLHLLLG